MKIPIKKERIYRILALEEHLTISAIARKSGLAKSYVSKVIKELGKKGIVWGTEKISVNYVDLLRAWGNLKKEIFQRIKPLRIDMLMPERLKTAIADYAVSGPFAELLIQGQSPGKPVIVYVSEEELEKKKKDLIKLGGIGKGQVWIYAYDPDIFSGVWEARSWKIVSVPQVCADLIALGTYADLGMKLFEGWLNAGRRV